MLFLIPLSACISTVTSPSDGAIFQSTCGPGNECLFKSSNQMNTKSYLVIYDLQPGDQIKYQYGSTSDPNNWDSNTFTLADESELNKVFVSSTQNQAISILVRPKTSRQIFARAGFTVDFICGGDTYFSTKDYFDLNEVLAESGKPRSTAFCLYFVHKHAETTVTNTLSSGKIIYSSGFTPLEISYGDSKSLSTDSQILRMKIEVKSSPENLHFDFTNIQGGGGYESFGQNTLNPVITPFETPVITLYFTPQGTFHSTPHSTAEYTPVITPFSTMHSTPHFTENFTPFSTAHSTPAQTMFSTNKETPSIEISSTPSSNNNEESPSPPTSVPTRTADPDIPEPTLEMTPQETWDGQYEDAPNVIIRGDDVPEIHETHPPIQTEFIKTQVPKKTTFVNVSIGTILIIIVVILTIVNIVRSYKTLRTAHYLSDEISDEDLTSDFLASYDTDDSADGFHVN